ncbi:MAG: GNAT family N-acetyltransferase [Candidatus Ancaeobacter aquaticus]|nr:GNAT family N-acetyltransferase [Candidatus Ancaeobacter aquaticus]
MDIKIKQIQDNDLDDVLDMQKQSFLKEYQEERDTYKRKLDYYPEGNKLLTYDGQNAGYIISHPSCENHVHELNKQEMSSTGEENCMYLHDLAIHPEYRNKGLTHVLMEYFHSLTHKEGYKTQALVAVQNSKSFWEKHEFKSVKEIEYGGEKAYYMKRHAE